jgi:hypothetical protein
MSWPQDGKPRYILSMIEGGYINDEKYLGGRWQPEYSILDRAYCHRQTFRITVGVQVWDKEKRKLVGVSPRQIAEQRLEELNAAC